MEVIPLVKKPNVPSFPPTNASFVASQSADVTDNDIVQDASAVTLGVNSPELYTDAGRNRVMHANLLSQNSNLSLSVSKLMRRLLNLKNKNIDYQPIPSHNQFNSNESLNLSVSESQKSDENKRSSCCCCCCGKSLAKILK